MTNLKQKISISVIIFSFIFAAYSEVFKIDMVKLPDQNIIMLTTEVTQELYEKVMGENPSKFQGNRNLPADGEKQSKRPVDQVSWYDAIYFCNKLSKFAKKTPVYSVDGITDVKKWNYEPHKGYTIKGTVEQKLNANGYRLPTVEEWQNAARGGKDFKYSGSNNFDEVSWCVGNSSDQTHEVGKKKANNYGLYDMSGNVQEWCWDSDGSKERCSCGGAWDSYDYFCKVVNFGERYPEYQYYSIGFRIVRSAE